MCNFKVFILVTKGLGPGLSEGLFSPVGASPLTSAVPPQLPPLSEIRQMVTSNCVFCWGYGFLEFPFSRCPLHADSVFCPKFQWIFILSSGCSLPVLPLLREIVSVCKVCLFLCLSVLVSFSCSRNTSMLFPALSDCSGAMSLTSSKSHDAVYHDNLALMISWAL